MVVATSQSTPGGALRARRAFAVASAATVIALALLTAACASSSGSAAASSATATGGSAGPSAGVTGNGSGVCGKDAVAATYQTAYDGTQPLCKGFAGDGEHAGEGLAGAQTDAAIGTVVQWMLLHARAVYSFQPTPAWLAASPHPRDVNGFFHRQTSPAPGDTAMRAYKDFVTPAPGHAGNERDYALVSVIVSLKPQADSARGGTAGGVWFVGCLVYHSDAKEYLEPCPSWVWAAPVVPAVKRRL
jgi:hypothetical protein